MTQSLKKLCFTLAGAALFWSASLNAQAPAQSPPPFSADVQILSKGAVSASGKFFMGKPGVRMEMKIGEMSQTQILRIDKDVAWAVMKEMGMYMEMPLQYNAMVNKKWNNLEEQCVAEEVIDGHPTQKCRIQTTVEGKKVSSLVWKARDLNGTVIRTVTEDLSTGMELKNIKPGPQPDHLFDEPVGLKKIQMTAGVADMVKTLGEGKLK